MTELRLSEERTLCELYGLFEVFRRLGFTPDEIYFVPECLGPFGLTVGMAVQAQGHLFLVSVDNGLLEAAVVWPTFAAALNVVTQERLSQLWDEATIGPRCVLEIALAMTSKGMVVPNLPQLKELGALRGN